MSKILCVWEQGSNFGHLGNFSPLIDELITRGHEICFAVKDLARIEAFSWSTQVTFIQAPIWQARLRKPIATFCFADILLATGYQSASTLRPLVIAWTHMFRLVKPDLIIFDHAPTALLASRALDIPRMIISNGFITPPAGMPPVNLRPWEAVQPGRIEASERRVLEVINSLAKDFHFLEIAQVSDLFAVDKVVIAGFEAIDFYRSTRENAIYTGSFLSADGHQKPYWAMGGSHKIFAYLKYSYQQVEPIFTLFLKLNLNVVCFCPDITAEAHEKYHRGNLCISNKPYDVRAVLEEADIVISHAGVGMISSCLFFGRPMMLVPTQLEQINSSKRLEELGLAVGIAGDDSAELIEHKLGSLINESGYFDNARNFSAQINTNPAPTSLHAICDICESLL